MADPDVWRIFEALRASEFRGVSGARVTATIPISERLLNETAAALLSSSSPVRDLTFHPQAGNRLGLKFRLRRFDFLPALTATLIIERQPELPHAPTLVVRVIGFAGLLTFAGPLLSLQSKLPPGLRLEGDVLTIDIAELLQRQGHGEWLGYLTRFRLMSEAGRLVVDADAMVP